MKLNNLLQENQASKSEISIADVFYEKEHLDREGFKVFNNFLSLAPNGKPLAEWQGNITLEELPITTLDGFPKKVNGDVTLTRLKISSLEGIGEISGSLQIQGLGIKNFNGCGNVKEMDVSFCNLTDFKGLPKYLRIFVLAHCPLKSFEGFPDFVEKLIIYGQGSAESYTLREFLTSIKAAGEIQINLDVLKNNNELPLLGFLKIQQLHKVAFHHSVITEDLKNALDIINNHLPGGNVFDCQEELLANGLEKYAKL